MSDRCDAVRDLAPGFVLGALTPDEDRLVRDHLATCDRPHEEFAELGGVVPYLAETAPVAQPPAALKGRILAAAAAERAGSTAVMGGLGGPTPPASVARPVPAAERPRADNVPIALDDARTAARRARGGGRPAGAWWAFAAAAVIAIAAMGGWNLLLQRELDTTRQYQTGLAAVLDLASEQGSQTAVLRADGAGGPTGLAAVTPDGRVAIVMRDLAPTTGREVYEAWLIGGDGSPRPIGGFTVGAGGQATFTTAGVATEPGVTVALTREPAPGATAPTLPIVSAGQATGPGS